MISNSTSDSDWIRCDTKATAAIAPISTPPDPAGDTNYFIRMSTPSDDEIADGATPGYLVAELEDPSLPVDLLYSNLIESDFTGWDRFIDDPRTDPDPGNPGAPGPPVVDMGSYEYLFIDLDYDGDVDLDDCTVWQNCISGPVGPVTPGCEYADFDNDDDADLSEFGILQRCYTGANNLADPHCAD